MIDLDHFKRINDSYGHAVGDIVISSVATLLRKRLRRNDRAGRYGGEEFLGIMPNSSAEDAAMLIDSILLAFRDVKFVAQDHNFSCTFSAGIVCSNSCHMNAETLIQSADQALYQAKKNGRNQVYIV